MTMFEALFLTIPISFAASTVLAAITARSLRATLQETAEEFNSDTYWVPYSIVMLYLVPLFIGLVFGVGTIPRDGVLVASGVTRIFTSVLGGCLLVLAGTGLQLSKHNQRILLLRATNTPRWRRNDAQ